MSETVSQWRTFKGDKWNRLYGSRIPDGATVSVLKFLADRSAIVDYEGMKINTGLWCLMKYGTRGLTCA